MAPLKRICLTGEACSLARCLTRKVLVQLGQRHNRCVVASGCMSRYGLVIFSPHRMLWCKRLVACLQTKHSMCAVTSYENHRFPRFHRTELCLVPACRNDLGLRCGHVILPAQPLWPSISDNGYRVVTPSSATSPYSSGACPLHHNSHRAPTKPSSRASLVLSTPPQSSLGSRPIQRSSSLLGNSRLHLDHDLCRRDLIVQPCPPERNRSRPR